MSNYEALAVILAILLVAIAYIIVAKKNGQKCIGCSSSKSCGSKNTTEKCNCGCDKN